MSALASVATVFPTVDPAPPVISFDSVTAVITSVATAYGPAILTVFGIGAGIMAIVWGFPKLIGLFKKSAK